VVKGWATVDVKTPEVLDTDKVEGAEGTAVIIKGTIETVIPLEALTPFKRVVLAEQ